MRILIVADPIESFKTYKDSTYAIMVAAVERGHTLAFCEQPFCHPERVVALQQRPLRPVHLCPAYRLGRGVCRRAAAVWKRWR